MNKIKRQRSEPIEIEIVCWGTIANESGDEEGAIPFLEGFQTI